MHRPAHPARQPQDEPRAVTRATHAVGFRMPPEASGPVRTTGELEQRLHRRLRVLSTIWACAAGVLAVTAAATHWDGIRLEPSTFWTVPPLPGVLLLVSMLMGGTAWTLSRLRRPGLRRLRAIEWLGVATMGGYFALNQIFTVTSFLPDGPVRPMEIGVAQGTPWGTLIVAYGVLIPSSLRHGALRTAILVTFAFLPEVLVLPRIDALSSGHATYVALKLLIIAVLSALALYGAYRIEVLSQDADAARELGQYRLLRLLGEGGMGRVYLAEHRFLRRPCAVKMIRAEQAGDAAALARFEREVQSAASLTHPNTVQIHDYGESEDGTFYFAMEYLPGVALDELVEREGPLAPARAVHILTQLCGALQEAHARGLVHRDLKPGNVMLCERGGAPDVAKLLDFGLVAAVRTSPTDPRITEAGMLIGSPAFMSPEQCMGDVEVTAASDIYSLGALGYFLLTGSAPFSGRGAMQTVVAHVHATPRPVVESSPEVPVPLSDVIARCLAKLPAERYADAASLAQALRASIERTAPHGQGIRGEKWGAALHGAGSPSAGADAPG
jgi:tRNA A-37 threonylcarbamoyl transferase component Bud32